MPPKLPSVFAHFIPRAPTRLLTPSRPIWTCATCASRSTLTPRLANSALSHYGGRRPSPLFAVTQPSSPHRLNRSVHATSPLQRNPRGKGDSKRTVPLNAAKTEGITDPSDFSVFENEIARVLEKLKAELRGIKAGGLDAEKIEGLRVRLGGKGGGAKGKGGKGGEEGTWVKVGEVAQVVQRGRVMVVMVGDADHIPPLTSTLLTALSITPSIPPHAPLELHLPIPPTTADSRAAAIKEVSQKGEAALFAIKEARAAQKKKLRALELARKVGPDELRRAEKEMEGVNERAGEAVRKVVEERRRGLER